MRAEGAVKVGAAVLLVAALALGIYILMPRGSSGRNAAEALTRTYVAELTEALKTLSPSAFSDAVGEDQQQRVLNQITLLWNQGLYLDSQRISAEVKTYDPGGTDSPQKLQIREKWRTVQRSRDTGKAEGEVTTFDQLVEYTIAPEDGGLRVVDVKVLKEYKGRE